MPTAEPIIMPGYQGEYIYGPYDDPDGEYEEPLRMGGVSVEQAFELFSAAAPEGWRVELIEGEICVTPPANGEHEEIVSEVNHQVGRKVRDDSLRNFTGIGLTVPGSSATGHVVPDLVIAPKGSFGDQEEWHEPSPSSSSPRSPPTARPPTTARRRSVATPGRGSPSTSSSTGRRGK